MTGEGKLTFSNGDVHSGAFVNGVPHGKGEFAFADGNKQIGDNGEYKANPAL